MTVIKVKPHKELCPDGAVLEADPGQTLAEVLLENDVKIEHACELSCACTTCHVIVSLSLLSNSSGLLLIFSHYYCLDRLESPLNL